MQSVSVFGATGSIGCTTAQILAAQSDKFSVKVLTGGSNVADLAEKAIALKPEYVVIADESCLQDLRDALKGQSVMIGTGRQALLEAANIPVDISLQGIVGFPGVECSLVAAKSAKVLALANKESLVCAGQLLRTVCAENDTTLLPVDSEHSAIFQCLLGEDIKTVERIILTASGGPFLKTPLADLKDVTAEQAAAHPRWSMGRRISIDSASMFNKAMELIETKELFEISPDILEVIVQPQSIIHSMVGFNDGAIMAHLGPPDMAGAIGYALNYPDRVQMPLERLDFAKLGRLDFQPIDAEKFPAIELAMRAMRMGGLAGTVFNAAKEQALDLFLEGQIKFLDMSRLVKAALQEYEITNFNLDVTIENVIAQDSHSRLCALQKAKGL
jgi:1-deoxy-D-xylulose-5-phosphate reductoisomerase